MNKKIIDISVWENEDLDVTHLYSELEISTCKTDKNSTKDIKNNLEDISYIWNTDTIVNETKTKNFDSVIRDKRLKDIDASGRPSFIRTFIWWLKWKVTLSGIPVSVFKEKKFFTKNFFKNIFIIFIIIWIFLTIDKFVVQNRINAGYEKILSIKDNSGDIEFIKKTVNNAKLDFIFSDILFKPFLLIPNKNIENWYNILLGWKSLTTLLDSWIQTYVATKKFIDSKNGIENVKLTTLLTNLRSDLTSTTRLLYSTIVSYNNITDLPTDQLNHKLNYAKNKLKFAYKYLDILNKDYDVFLNILWNEKEKKYLILFQNNDEIRATWWFIWSLAIATIKDWKILDLANDDVYAYEWEINKVFPNKNPAPEWLNKITDTFWFRDSNYFIDFWSSSKSINFFLEKIDKKVDGVIYINQNVVHDFIKYTGWIYFDKLDKTVTDENFSLIFSTLIEAQSFKLWTLGSPKKLLFDFSEKLFQTLKIKKDYYAYLDIILKNVKSRDLVLYSFNTEENNFLWKLWLNWKIKYSDTLDFSYPVFTSIWWNKSDRYIELKYKKNVEKNSDCSIDTNLQIFRTHLFSKFEETKVNNLLDEYPIQDKTRKDIVNIQWKWVNKSFVRVVLPLNAIVEKKPNLNINKYEKATVVDFYQNTRVLETTNFNIKYKIPNRDCKKYDFKFYKQPGIRDYNIEIIEWKKVIKKYRIEGDYIYR